MAAAFVLPVASQPAVGPCLHVGLFHLHRSPVSSRIPRAALRQERRLTSFSVLNDTKGFGAKKRAAPPKEAVEKKTRKPSSATTDDNIPAPPRVSPQAQERLQRHYQGLPPIVSERMLNRMLAFAGVPLLLALTCFPLFYFSQKKFDIALDPIIPFAVTSFMFFIAAAGISYGLISTSWDPALKGSVLGVDEFRSNLPRLMKMVQEFAAQSPVDKDD